MECRYSKQAVKGGKDKDVSCSITQTKHQKKRRNMRQCSKTLGWAEGSKSEGSRHADLISPKGFKP